jgi:cytochrome P450
MSVHDTAPATTGNNPLGVDFDVTDPALAPSPYELWRRFRHQSPVIRSEALGGFYVIPRYSDLCTAAADVDTFRSFPSSAIPPLPWPPMPPIEYDNPLHHKFRTIINPYLSPSRVRDHEGWLRAWTKSFTDRVFQVDAFDFAQDFARPYTRGVALHFMGFPEDDQELGRNIDVLMADRDLSQQHVAHAAGAFLGAITQLMATRREQPEDDLISGLVGAEIDGEPLADEQVMLTIVAVALGGLDTTSGALAAAATHLMDNPTDRQRLLAEPRLIDTAVDEFVRWAAALTGTARTVSKDTEFAGCPMKRGDRVWLLWGSGSRDETVFEEPENVLLDRRPNRHLAFGLGPHRCVGAHVAKGILRIAIPEIAAQIGAYAVEDASKIEWVARETRGMTRLPLIRCKR